VKASSFDVALRDKNLGDPVSIWRLGTKSLEFHFAAREGVE
jgi:hypothetical protein